MKYASVLLALGCLATAVARAAPIRLASAPLPAGAFTRTDYEWAPPHQLGVATESRFGLDCYGRLWCVLLDRPILHAESSSFSASRYDGNQWLEPEPVFRGGLACGLGGFDATRAQDGRLWVLMSAEYSVSDSATAALYFDGATWSGITIMGRSCVDVSTGFSLESDSAGKIWAVFSVGEDYRVWADVCDDTSWSGAHPIVAFPTGEQVAFSRLTVAPNGDLWAGATALYPHYDRVFLCRSDSAGNWSDSLIFGPGPTEGVLRGLAADSRGNIWVTWAGNPYGPDSGIYAAYLDTGLHWSPVFRIAYSGLFCSMEIDGDNKVWVVWDADSNFYYRVWDGAEWGPPDSIVQAPASSSFMDAIFHDPIRDRVWVSYRTGYEQTFVTWTDPSGGVAEDSPRQLGSGRKLAATVTRILPQGAVVFDAMGRRVLNPRSGILFVREPSAIGRGPSAVTKVVIAE